MGLLRGPLGRGTGHGMGGGAGGNAMIARLLANAMVMVSGVLGQHFMRAYREHLQSAHATQHAATLRVVASVRRRFSCFSASLSLSFLPASCSALFFLLLCISR